LARVAKERGGKFFDPITCRRRSPLAKSIAFRSRSQSHVRKQRDKSREGKRFASIKVRAQGISASRKWPRSKSTGQKIRPEKPARIGCKV